MSENKILTRFAPSPTGDLHIGNARSALLNWVYSKKYNGNFILRIDDTDNIRTNEKFISSIKNDLILLNINWSKSFKQSERIKLYDKKINELKTIKRLYPCFETTEELTLKRKALLSSGKPPIYDRSSLKLNENQINNLISQGKKPHWRFFLEDKIIIWNDIIRGEVIFNSKNLSDPILIRENGSFLYHLPSVADDINENITDIIRGEDHVTNTVFHIQLFEALNAKVPNFGHHPLLLDEKGKGLGKRLGSLSINSILEEGFEPLTIMNYLLTIGTSKNLSSEINSELIVDSFKIKDLARSSPKFIKNDLIKINSDILKKLNFDSIREKLINLGIDNPNNEFWNLIKNNIFYLKESVEWWKILSSKEIYYNEEGDFFDECISVLPKEPYTNKTWDEWINKIKSISSRRGEKLFMPLRLALTGKKIGPELKYLIPLLSKKIILHRLGK